MRRLRKVLVQEVEYPASDEEVARLQGALSTVGIVVTPESAMHLWHTYCEYTWAATWLPVPESLELIVRYLTEDADDGR